MWPHEGPEAVDAVFTQGEITLPGADLSKQKAWRDLGPS